MREEAVLFGKTSSLVGVITDPTPLPPGSPAPLPAILLLNAGRVHRVGPNRLYVNIARALAEMGFTVLRFDLSGIGDSPARDDNLPFKESALSETQEAMNYLRSSREIECFILIGICSGAVLSFKIACRDSRVVGAFIINGQNHLHDSDGELNSSVSRLALVRHYWRIAFSSSFKLKNWLKALKGKVDYWRFFKALTSLSFGKLLTGRGHPVLAVSRVVAALRLLTERGVRLLHVYSEGDQSLDYYQVIVDNVLPKEKAGKLLRAEVIPGVNHVFTTLWSQDELLRILCEWLQEFVKGEPARCRRS